MSKPNRLVRETAALILHRAGYSVEQVNRLLQEHLTPLRGALLTHDLLDQAAEMLRRAGFTYYGVGTALEALRIGLPPLPAAAPAGAPAPVDQLDLFPPG